MTRSALLCGALCAAVLACSASVAADRSKPADTPRKIVLIGGAKSESAGRHDYPNAIRVLARLLKSSPDLSGLDVESHPAGWPADGALDRASTVVLYFDGLDKHPLLVTGHRESFEAAMRATDVRCYNRDGHREH